MSGDAKPGDAKTGDAKTGDAKTGERDRPTPTLGDILRHVASEPDFPALITRVAQVNPRFLRDLGEALVERQQFDHARALAALLHRCADFDLDAALLGLDLLSGCGDVELVLDRVLELKAGRWGATDVLLEAIRTHVMAAMIVYNGCMSRHEVERGVAICDRMMTIYPGLTIAHDAHREARERLFHKRVVAYLVELNEAACAYQSHRNIAEEEKLRLELHRHPFRHLLQGTLVVFNSIELLSRLLAVDVDHFPPERVALAREVQATIAAAPVRLPRQEGDIGCWERCLRLLAQNIDLDAVFGPPVGPLPPLPTAFADARGAALSLDEIAQRCRTLGARAVFTCSTSPEYFVRYARTYVDSILANCDCDCLIVICICVPFGRLGEVIASLRGTGPALDDPRLVFSCDDFDGQPISMFMPRGYAPLTTPGPYYACGALLRTDALLQKLGLPVFVTGIDTALQRGVVDLLDRFADADVVVNKLGSYVSLGSQLINNLVLLFPTKTAALFVDFLKQYLGGHLRQPVQPAAIDQLDLHMAKHHLLANVPDAALRYFDEPDINCVMFNHDSFRNNREQMRSYRFLNIYAGAFDDIKRLRIEDITAEAA